MRYFRFSLAAGGVVFVVAGVLAAYWWHYTLAPSRHLADPTWLAAHSESARWDEEQKDYRRREASPDLCFRGDRIGFYGDKQWFLWLEERIRNPERFRHCGCTEYALALMANRHVDSWSQWTDANRGRSQVEWIRDGFLEYGINAHVPPSSEDTLPLLRLLGRRSWNLLWGGPQGTNAPGAVPSYIHYNAYRWLRDSGFEPGKFAASNVTATAQSDITAGLLRYSQWRSAYPGHDGLGVLAFGASQATGFGLGMRSPISNPWLGVGVDALIVVCIVGGGVLVWRFRRRTADSRKDSEVGPPQISQMDTD